MKYLKILYYSLKQQLKLNINFFGSIISYVVHIYIFGQMWDFVLQGKQLDGFDKAGLIWYIIIAEVFMYSFHNMYKKIAKLIQNGDIAYGMSKPYVFIYKIIAEEMGTLPKTLTMLVLGICLGLIFTGNLIFNVTHLPLIMLVFVLALVLQLMIHLIVGLLSIWLGYDVTSIWWIVSKFMLILVLTPIDFFGKKAQFIANLLPTTHAVYTPSKLFVHFEYGLFFTSLMYEILSLMLLGSICYLIYRKGVKKLNVNGI